MNEKESAKSDEAPKRTRKQPVSKKPEQSWWSRHQKMIIYIAILSALITVVLLTVWHFSETIKNLSIKLEKAEEKISYLETKLNDLQQNQQIMSQNLQHMQLTLKEKFDAEELQSKSIQVDDEILKMLEEANQRDNNQADGGSWKKFVLIAVGLILLVVVIIIIDTFRTRNRL